MERVGGEKINIFQKYGMFTNKTSVILSLSIHWGGKKKKLKTTSVRMCVPQMYYTGILAV